MSKREKRLQKLRQNPKDVAFTELEQVLNDYGILRDHATGSHYVFRYNINGQDMKISIPYNKPVKAIYVKRSIEIIDLIKAELDKENDNEENN
ncbi:MAG: hypothetical protein GC179_13160 [Anaerolineaceae bacterium]|nr:hypothetical protein [Anaerolineaceae bacterium]